jgi:hypothetical protein
MSFLFLMIKIALVIYVVKFFWSVAFGLLTLKSVNKTGPELSVLDDILTADDSTGSAK